MRSKLEEQTAVDGKEQIPARVALVDPPSVALPSEEAPRPRSLHSYRAEAEANAISRALEMVGWNRRRAAELLRISYRGLLYKIRQYKITAATKGEGKPHTGGQQLDEM